MRQTMPSHYAFPGRALDGEDEEVAADLGAVGQDCLFSHYEVPIFRDQKL